MNDYWKCPYCYRINLAPNEICSTCESSVPNSVKFDGKIKFTDGSVYDIVDIIPRSSVQWFAKHMEIELKENDHKPGWDSEPLDFLVMRLEDEVYELKQSVFDDDRTNEDIISEAADVANFAMMIAERYRKG